jgi:hypothetical protein
MELQGVDRFSPVDSGPFDTSQEWTVDMIVLDIAVN